MTSRILSIALCYIAAASEPMLDDAIPRVRQLRGEIKASAASEDSKEPPVTNGVVSEAETEDANGDENHYEDGNENQDGNDDEVVEGVSHEARIPRPRIGNDRRRSPYNFIQIDGDKETPVQRVKMPNAFVREVLVQYPLEHNKIEVQGDKAFIPLKSFLEGTFIRDAKDGEQKDFGVVKAVPFVTPSSMISDKVKFAFGEKSHTLYFPAGVSRHTEQKLAAIKKKQTPKQVRLAREHADDRHVSLSLSGIALGGQIIGAGKDRRHVAAVRKYASQNNSAVTETFWSAWQKADQEMDEWRTLWKLTNTTKPLRSSIGCMHYESAEDMIFTNKGVWVPLDKMIPGYRGRLASVPNSEYQMSTGVTFFHYNSDKKTLDIYLGFSSVVDIYDTATHPEARFLVGPVDGVGDGTAHEGRKRSTHFNQIFKMSAKETAKYDMDFQFMHMHRSQLGCNNARLGKLARNVRNLQTVLDGFNNPSKRTIRKATKKVGTTLANVWGLLKGQVNCAVEYVRDDSSDTLLFGIFEAVGLLHVLMEMPGDLQYLSFESSEAWNNLNFGLHGPLSAQSPLSGQLMFYP